MFGKIIHTVKDLTRKLIDREPKKCLGWTWNDTEKKNLCMVPRPGLLTSYKNFLHPCNCVDICFVAKGMEKWPNVRNPSYYNGPIAEEVLKYREKVMRRK